LLLIIKIEFGMMYPMTRYNDPQVYTHCDKYDDIIIQKDG